MTYVLEPTRVGRANSPFTTTPDNLISSTSAFEGYYTVLDESVPRTDYMVQVVSEGLVGTGPGGSKSLADAVFGWTKNEGQLQSGGLVPFDRFGYSGADQRFQPLRGVVRSTLGNLSPDANTTRLSISLPLEDLSAFPARLSIGSSGSGVTLILVFVSSFGSPLEGVVEVLRLSGELNWNPSDLLAYEGQPIYFQGQSFDSNLNSYGSLGLVGDVVFLTPIPASGQLPQVSFGVRSPLTPIEVLDDSALSSDPASGTFEWSLDTGLVRFNSSDLIDFSGDRVLYLGTLLGLFQVPATTIGAIGTVLSVPTIPETTSDTFFRVPGQVQFSKTTFVETFSTVPQGEVQLNTATGELRLSSADIAAYSGSTLEMVVPDIEIERGISLRLFRSLVNPDGLADAKDVTAIYTVGVETPANISNPMIGQPYVTLPLSPLEDEDLTVIVRGGDRDVVLHRIDKDGANAGVGYVLDSAAKTLSYGQRFVDVLIPGSLTSVGAIQLPQAPVFDQALTLARETYPGSGGFEPLIRGVDYDVDLGSGTITFSSSKGTQTLTSTSGAFLSESDLTDFDQDFITLGITSGDIIHVGSGVNAGFYTVVGVSLHVLGLKEVVGTVSPTPVSYSILQDIEIIADALWSPIQYALSAVTISRHTNLGPADNISRLSINPSRIEAYTLSSEDSNLAMVQVVDSNQFSAPTSLDPLVVEVSLATGALNFPTTLVGLEIKSSLVELPSNYRIQPGLGLIELANPLIVDEWCTVLYIYSGNGVLNQVTETAKYLVSKELVQPHPQATDTVFFNPGGKLLADTSPAVWRGGRPQSASQFTYSLSSSSITFLSDSTLTEALPHGATISPSENVYVDYYIERALGGEKRIRTSNRPIYEAKLSLDAGTTSITLEGDWSATILQASVIRIDGGDVYLVTSVAYSGSSTEITLGQPLRLDYESPLLEVTTRSLVDYFETISDTINTVPVGGKSLTLMGDVSSKYVGGTILRAVVGTSYYYFAVAGSSYLSESNETLIKFTGVAPNQIDSTSLWQASKRVVYPLSQTVFQTRLSPLSLDDTLAFSQVGQAAGTQISGTPLDTSGRINLGRSLVPGESLYCAYRGYTLVDAYLRHLATWSAVIVPNAANGLVGQALKMAYTTYSPDTFYWRVEPLSALRGELMDQFEADAKSSIPSQGPTLENPEGTTLSNQGAPSMFFYERRYANEDTVARGALLFYHEAINYLEDYFTAADGRMVGDSDGRFLYDGLDTNPVRSSFFEVTNQIDDHFIVYSGSEKKAYTAGSYSRFYPTRRISVGQVGATPSNTGDIIFDTGYKPLTSLNTIIESSPRALTQEYVPEGATSLVVDSTAESVENKRRAFSSGMKVDLINQEGTVLESALTISTVGPQEITFSTALSQCIPTGVTVALTQGDYSSRRVYRPYTDVAAVYESGLLGFIDSSFLPSPPFPSQTIPQAGEWWDVSIELNYQDTRPFRFPALDGIATDDDGNTGVPILTPHASSELATIVDERLAAAEIVSSTISQTIYTGTVQPSGTVISVTGVLDLLPQVGDLVRVLSGVNADIPKWVQVVGGSTTSISLSSSLTPDLNVSFIISTTPSLAVGAGAPVSVAGYVLTDLSADFGASGVLPGHTVVISSGVNALLRRNVSKVSATTLTLTDTLTSTSSFDYRVVNPLCTFGEAVDSSAGRLVSSLIAQQSALTEAVTSQTASLQGFLAHVSELKLTSTGEASGSILTDLTVDFLALGISSSDLLLVMYGGNLGVYGISTVTETTLGLDTTFLEANANQTYLVVQASGVSRSSFEKVLPVLSKSDSQAASTATYEGLWEPITVVGDPSAYASGVLVSDIVARDLTGREDQVSSDVSSIETILNNSDRLYDVRYSWIDGRINWQTGILVKQERASTQRAQNLEDARLNLLRILSA